MDLSGAFDSVDCNLLFVGPGQFSFAHSISTLCSLYEDTQCIVKLHHGCGLRQGCPLSTNLFC